MGYYPNCDDIIPLHTCDPCESKEFGRVRSVALVKKSFEFTDITSPTEWQTGIASGDIIVIPDTNGELAEPSPNEGEGFGDNATDLINYGFELTFQDPNYKSNCDFYNAIKGKRLFKLAYVTSSQVHLTDVTVTIIPSAPIANDLNSRVTWNVVAKWVSENLPCPSDKPDGIFDACYIPE